MSATLASQSAGAASRAGSTSSGAANAGKAGITGLLGTPVMVAALPFINGGISGMVVSCDRPHSMVLKLTGCTSGYGSHPAHRHDQSSTSNGKPHDTRRSSSISSLRRTIHDLAGNVHRSISRSAATSSLHYRSNWIVRYVHGKLDKESSRCRSTCWLC
jgi:hypothetical protein